MRVVRWLARMVGSVLMQRMHAEPNFALIEPCFSPLTGREMGLLRWEGSAPLKDAKQRKISPRWTSSCPARAVTYTNAIFPQLRASGWKGYWVDARVRAAYALTTPEHPWIRSTCHVINDALSGGAHTTSRQLHREPDVSWACTACQRPIWSSGSRR